MTTANSFCLDDILLCSLATTCCTDPPFPTLSSQFLVLFALVSDDLGIRKNPRPLCSPLLDPHPHTMHKTIVNSPTFLHISSSFRSHCLLSRDTNMVASNRCQAKGHVGEKQEYPNTLIALYPNAFIPLCPNTLIPLYPKNLILQFPNDVIS